MVSMESASLSVSILSARSASPEKACTTSYADFVRETGIVEPFASWPEPSGFRARNIAPSRVLTLISAPVWVPNFEGVSTLNVTSTLLPSRSTPVTLPTRTPAMRTSSLGLMPPPSVNEAW